MSAAGPVLGCRVSDLEVGTEFSIDEGRTWLVVRTEPRYLREEGTLMRFMAAPWDSVGLSAWREVDLDESEKVLLEREWGSAVKSGSDLG